VNSAISPAWAFAYSPFGSRRSHSAREVATWTSTNGACSSVSARAFRRASSYGEIAETTTAAPARASREATQPIRSMFVSRSSFDEPVDEHAARLELGGDERRDRRLARGREPGEPEDEAAPLAHAFSSVCRPHSVFSAPAQRPSRPEPGSVQCVQPIDA
jgi:hypothetical protein